MQIKRTVRSNHDHRVRHQFCQVLYYTKISRDVLYQILGIHSINHELLIILLALNKVIEFLLLWFFFFFAYHRMLTTDVPQPRNCSEYEGTMKNDIVMEDLSMCISFIRCLHYVCH